MDTVDLFKMSGASAGTIAIVLLVYRIGKSLLGKKLISNCCGRKLEVGVDIQPSTPNDVAISIKNPIHSRDESQNKSREERSHSDQRQDSPK